MKKMSMMLMAAAVMMTGSALAQEKALNITENTAGLSEQFTTSIAKTAVSMGVKEPLVISKSGNDAKITGATATVCLIKLSGETIQGVSCK